jgi:hypothetical protein
MANTDSTHKTKWTIMIYMAVDDAVGIPEAKKFLEELNDLKHIIPAVNPSEEEYRGLRIFLQAYTNWSGQAGDFRSKRFEIDENFDVGKPFNVEFEENLSMGDSNALSDFIKWCKDTAGHERKHLLFLWGHGTGSSMFSLQEPYKSIKQLYNDDLTLIDLGTDRPINNIEDLSPEKLFKDRNKVKIRITLRGITSFDLTFSKRTTDFYKGLPHPDKNEIITEPVTLIDLLPDGTDTQALSPEIERLKKFLTTRSNLDGLLEQEISKCLKKKGNEVDLLLIMGCCMQMVEFGYELASDKDADHSFFYVASEELIYFDGYNYKDSFKALAENPQMDPASLARRIVLDAPVKNTYTEYQRQSLAISCVDLNKSKKLAYYLDEFADWILNVKDDDIKEDVWRKIKKARKQCRHFGEDAYTYSFIDVTWFFMRFNHLVKTNYKNYPDEFRDLVNRMVTFLQFEYIVQPWIGAGRIPSLNYSRSYGGHGVGIYFPESKEAHANNKDLGIFFDREIIDENKKKKPNSKANEFTLQNSWYDFILKYREDYGEMSSYLLTGSLAPVDKEKKILLAEANDLKNIVVEQLLEIDEIKSGVIAELLLKNNKS